MAQNAPTPDGYSRVFDNLGASLQASNYMGLYTLTSYDTLTCASKCDQADGCEAFNVYLERDPTVDANEQMCPNPQAQPIIDAPYGALRCAQKRLPTPDSTERNSMS